MDNPETLATFVHKTQDEGKKKTPVITNIQYRKVKDDNMENGNIRDDSYVFVLYKYGFCFLFLMCECRY